jgi:hypothetical protein
MSSQALLGRICETVLDHRYALSEHAYDEMDRDGLDALDVEAAILTGTLEEILTQDPRGPRYVIVGKACDLRTRVGVVVRFLESDRLLVVTVYEIK